MLGIVGESGCGKSRAMW
ncbi:MAG: hypothetical protein ACLUPK_01130 [Veillonella sp.]